MRPGKLVLLSALTAAVATPLRAQSVGKMLVTDVRDAAGDIVGVWASPFHASGRSWLEAVGAIGASALVSVADDDVDRWMVRNRNASAWSALKQVREGGAAFTGNHVTPVVGALYVIGLATRSTPLRDGVFGCLSSYASESVVRTQILYRLIGRERPDSSRRHVVTAPPALGGDQYDFEVGSKEWGMHSFPAGHVANVAACASFLNNRFAMGVVEPALYIVVAGVGVGRMVDRRHWTSDTVLGTLFGIAVGKEVAKRQKDRRSRDQNAPLLTNDKDQRGLYLDGGRGGLTVGWHVTF